MRFLLIILMLFTGCVSTGEMTDDEKDWMKENMRELGRGCPAYHETCDIYIWTDGEGNIIDN